jgi:hypothetical protein
LGCSDTRGDGAFQSFGFCPNGPLLSCWHRTTPIGYEQGWFQVLDPVTSERGWIYEKYYLQAIRGPGQMIALQEPAKPQQKPTPHVRRAKSLAPRPAKKIQPLIASAPRYRYETIASILDRALRP